MEVQVVYSLGVRCDTEIILKRLGLVKFSSLFGSMNIRNYTNLIKCFDTNFKILLDESNLIFTKDNPAWDIQNKAHGFRTLNIAFDNPNDYHSATIAHHDLSNSEHKQHFVRAVNRLNYIRSKNIPIVFINISVSTEFENKQYNPFLIDSIIKSGFTNMKILSICITNAVSELQLEHISDHMIIYRIPFLGDVDTRYDTIIEDIIRKHFNCDNLLTINDFPA